MIKAIGTATLASKTSTKQVYVASKDMSWEHVSSNERSDGVERVWEGQPVGGPFHFLKWTVYEYPTGSLNMVDHDFDKFTLVDDFSFEFD